MQQTFMRRFRRLAPLAGLALAGGLAACEDFLTAENPGAIEAVDLDDERYITLISNGVIGEFQFANAHLTWWNGLFSGEFFNRSTPVDEPQIARRNVVPENGTYSFFMYGNIHRARFIADDAVRRLKIILGDSASRNINVARSLAYGGMTYVYLAEALCESPIDLSAPLSSDTIFARGIVRFDEAIATANAYKAVTGRSTTDSARADSIRHFALVGAARAYLNMNNKAKAIEYASQVPANFVFQAYYSENSSREYNYTATRIGVVNGGNLGTFANTPFDTVIGDPRLPRRGGSVAATAPIPLAPQSYSTHSNTVAGANFNRANSVRVASGLEARYIIAEAQGPTAATLTFVNERRAVGLRPPVDYTGDRLMEELREQRSRDFYLDNHRLGDMRRYKRFYGVDKFPSGAYPGSTTPGDTYKDVSCWPLPISEINDNPNVPKPYTPATGP